MPPKFSIIPVRAFQDSTLHPAAFKVLASLGSYADKRGYCFPSQATLAKKLHVSRQAVNRQIRILVDHGYLKIARRVHPCGAELSCFYQILFDELDAGDKDTNERDTKEITLVSRLDLEYSGDKKNPEISKKSTLMHKAQFKTEKIPPGITENYVLQDKDPEIAKVADSETIIVVDPATPDGTVPETPEVAQTTPLTPSITPVVDEEKMESAGIKTNTPPHPGPIGIGNSKQRLSSSPPAVKTDAESSVGKEFEPKIASPAETQDFQDTHLDLQIYFYITHHHPRNWELGKVLLAMRTLRMRYPKDSDLLSFLKPFWERWCTSCRSNGTRYNPVNSAWLTDWALSAAMCVPTAVHIDSIVSSDPGSFSKAMDPRPEKRQ